MVAYDEDAVEEALDSLRSRGLALRITGAGSRVPKHGHRLAEQLNLGRREIAILCELMLRGPQTVGELRGRTERLHRFDDLDEVESILLRLMESSPAPLIARLERHPGEKEVRYAQLLSGAPRESPSGTAPPSPRADRLAELEADVSSLRQQIEDLRSQFADFRRQFD